MTEESFTLSISGMTCGACVASVEKVASKIDGVTEVSVNLPLNRAVVRLQPTAQFHSTKTKVITAIERSGLVQRNQEEGLYSLMKQNQIYADKGKKYPWPYS